jgi:hypothetical protein
MFFLCITALEEGCEQLISNEGKQQAADLHLTVQKVWSCKATFHILIHTTLILVKALLVVRKIWRKFACSSLQAAALLDCVAAWLTQNAEAFQEFVLSLLAPLVCLTETALQYAYASLFSERCAPSHPSSHPVLPEQIVICAVCLVLHILSKRSNSSLSFATIA